MSRTDIRQRVIAAVGAASLAILAAAGSQTPAQERGRADPKINEPFKNPDLGGFIKKFESEDREVYKMRHEIVAAVRLKPGMAVADVGAGTGLFTRLFADGVGPSGKVYAVDISAQFLAHIAAQAKKQGLGQVVTVRGSQDSTNLPPDSVDLVFVCDAYHHLEKPDLVLASMRQALRPGGRLVVIDFDRVEGKSSAFVLKHIRGTQGVFRKEIESAGFTPLPTAKKPQLKETFFLMFQKALPHTKPGRTKGEPK